MSPNPTPRDTLAFADVDQAQHIDCASRSGCIDTMAAIGAAGFTCSNCTAYTREAIESWRENIPALAGIGRLVARLAVTPDRRLPVLLRRDQRQRRDTPKRLTEETPCPSPRLPPSDPP